MAQQALPHKFVGSTIREWEYYIEEFKTFCSVFGWEDKHKVGLLKLSVNGPAKEKLSNKWGSLTTFNEVDGAVRQALGKPNEISLWTVQFQDAKRMDGEEVGKFSQRLLDLAKLAYPELNETAWERLSIEKFITMQSSKECRIRLRLSKPTSMAEALLLVREYELVEKVERFQSSYSVDNLSDSRSPVAAVERKNPNSLEATVVENTNNIQQILNALKEIKIAVNRPQSTDESSRRQNRRQRRVGRCWECGSEDHYQRNCDRKFRAPKN